MTVRIVLFPLAALLAGPTLAWAQAGQERAPTTVEGVTVQPQPAAALPKAACRPNDKACITLVVRALKQQYPEAFRNLSYWCMNKAASQMAMTIAASDLGYDPGSSFTAGAAQKASCDAVYLEAKKK